MFRTIEVQALALACIICGTFPLAAQLPPTTAPARLQDLGTKAVHVIVSQEIVNPYSQDDKTSKFLQTNGKWQVDAEAPAACTNTAQPCVRVIYRLPETSVSCEWVVLLSGDNSEGSIIEQNSDATKYFLRRLTTDQARDMVLKRKMPDYPPIAIAAHVMGDVTLIVVVDKDGRPANAVVLVGPEMLRFASTSAIKTWRFKPLKIGNDDVPFETTVEFAFRTTGPPSASVTSKP